MRELPGRKRLAVEESGRASSPEEALALISAAAVELAKLAHQHQFDVLVRILSMAQLEADEQLQTLSRKKLS